MTTDLEDHDKRIERLEAENISLRKDVDILKGLAHKQQLELDRMRTKQADQTAHNMKQNVIIHGIVIDKDGAGTINYKEVAKKFLTDTLGLESVEIKDIYKAHEHGNDIVIKVDWNLREKIFAKVYAGALKDKKNSKNFKYFVSEQLPESLNRF